MFRKRPKRFINIPFVIIRLIIAIVIFALMGGGIYAAYKHFSGLDPLKLDPQNIILNLLKTQVPSDLISVLSSIKMTEKFANQVNEKVLRSTQPSPQNSKTEVSKTQNAKLAFKFMLIADSHSDNVNLKRAVGQVKFDPQIKFTIGLGDYSDVGTLDELQAAKKVMDEVGLRYFMIPGDHDLWDARNRSLLPTTNFNQVFGPSYQSFDFDNFLFILVYNSDNYAGLNEDQLSWLQGELEKGKQYSQVLVFVHEPLFHPSSDHVMGRVEGSLKTQARVLINKFKEAKVLTVFAGDTHYFSQYEEPESKLSMTTIGAITTERNLQAPQFAVVSVFEDGSIKTEDVEIK